MSESFADRNLLVGILAVQLDFISRDQLVESMMQWVLNKEIPIDEILLSNKFIDESTRELVKALVQKHLEQHEGDAQKSLAAVSSIDASFRQKLQSIDDHVVEASLKIVAEKQDLSSSDISVFGKESTVEFGGKESGRYRVLRPHARGGLGEVHVAFDKELNREVALKEIQEHHADENDSRARFVKEAEVTGGLEHPGIVPVYGLGTYDNGRPFYAMRFIKGDSLKTAANKFHDSQNTRQDAKSFQSVEFRSLLRRFLDVCNAIEYAHARGVLHRDLKPGNIMLGKYGETLVVDWGLSKVIGRPDSFTDSDERTLVTSSASGTAHTQMGSALGTPQFMPPEQASGRLDQLGPQSDVYSLGATLYYLLVGNPPFEKPTDGVGELLNKVQSGDFPHPATANPKVPRPLNAICVKAMALKIEDRFASVKELAEEIDRWLADKPVKSFNEPISNRAGRFIRNHQVAVAATAILLVSITVGLIIFSSLIAINNSNLNNKNAQIESKSNEIDRVNTELTAANDDLSKANQHLATLKDESEKRRRLAEIRLAESLLEKGSKLCDAGNVDIGIQWIGKALSIVALESANDEKAKDLDNVLRFSLAYWQTKLLSVRSHFKYNSMVSVQVLGNDDDTLLTGSYDKSLRLRSVATGEAMGPLIECGAQVESGILLSDNQTVIVGCSDGGIRMFDGMTGTEKYELMATDLVREIGLTSDESMAVARTNRGNLLAFHVKTGEVIKVDWEVSGASDISVRPAAKEMIICKYREKKIAICDLVNGKNKKEKSFESSPSLVSYSPDGKYLVVVAGRLSILDAETLEVVSENLPQNGVRHIDFLPDSTKFVTAGIDGQAILFSLPDGKPLAPPLRHQGQVFDARISSDGQLIVTSSSKIAQVWDANTGEKVGQPLKDSGRILLSSDNRNLVTGSFNGDVRIWSILGKLDAPLRLDTKGFVLGAGTHSKKPFFACCGEDKTLRIWQTDREIQSRWNEALEPDVEIIEESEISALAIHPTESHIAIGNRQGEIKVLKSSGEVIPLDNMAHDSIVQSLGFSPDGKFLISGGDDSIVAVWDLSSGKLVGEPILVDGPPRSMSVGKYFSLANPQELEKNSSGYVVIGGVAKKPLVFDIRSQRKLYEFEHGDKSRSTNVAVSNNGTWIATGANDGQLKLWNSTTGQLAWAFDEFKRGFTTIEFSKDDQLLLVGGYDRLVRTIEVGSGKAVGKAINHDATISSACFALDQQVIISGDSDGFSKMSHSKTGFQIGSTERHRGEITVTTDVSSDKFLCGHGSLRLKHLVRVNDSVENLGTRLALLSAVEVLEDGTEKVVDHSYRQSLINKLNTIDAIDGHHFVIQGPDTKSIATLHNLSELSNPITREKGRFVKTYTSFKMPKR